MISSTASHVQKCVRKSSSVASRTFFSKSSAMPQVAIDEEFPSVPKGHSSAPKPAKVTASTTASGLKIASDSSDAHVASIGIEIAAGSRVETEATAGLSHLFSKMAFRSTESRSDLRLYRDIEAIGGVISTSSGRDYVRYNISVLPDKLDTAAEILAETTLSPRLANWDINVQKEKVKFDIEEAASCPATLVSDGLHAAAFYDDATLGRPTYSAENLSKYSSDDLWAFYEQYVNSASTVLVGSGVEHSVLTDVANDFFAQLPAGSASATKKAPAQYVGGESRVKVPAGASTFVSLGFKAPGKNASDFAAAQVLQALLTCRLDSKKAGGFLAAYEDVSVVGLTGYSASAQTGALVDSFVKEIKKAASSVVSNEELATAKAVAALEAASAVSSRQGRLARLGYVAATQKTASAVAGIEGVSAKAVQEAAQKALASRPSVASVGKVSAVPRLDALISKLK